MYTVLRVQGSIAVVQGPGGKERTASLSQAQQAHLQAGDLVRLSKDEEGARVGRAYPGALGRLLT